MLLKGKRALITGGSEGIGLAIADAFLKEGAQLVIAGRSQEKLVKAQAELGNDVQIYSADVAKIDDLDRMYDACCQKSKLDIIVAAAGISASKSLEESTEEDFDQIISINLKGVFFTVQRALPYLNEGASIILISSLAGKKGAPNYSVYCASKAGVISLAQSFAGELTSRKIRVNTISPGVIDTKILDKIGLTAETKQIWASKIPMKRFGVPQEIADAAVFLASNHSSYITATDIAVDGGLSGINTT